MIKWVELSSINYGKYNCKCDSKDEKQLCHKSNCDNFMFDMFMLQFKFDENYDHYYVQYVVFIYMQS